MTDPTTAITDLVRERGPMTRERLVGTYVPGHWALDAALASGTLREVEGRETCRVCEKSSGDIWRDDVLDAFYRPGAYVQCPRCEGYGTVPVTLLATPEQAALMDMLRAEPLRPWDLRAGRESPVLVTLLASGHVVRAARQCAACGGSGEERTRAGHDVDDPCLHCTDGEQTVYELGR